jgi:hypothetical protein
MRKLACLAFCGFVSLGASTLPTAAASLSLTHASSPNWMPEVTLTEQIRHRGWRHGWRGRHYGWYRGRHYGWYDPPRRYGYYRRAPGITFEFGPRPRRFYGDYYGGW